MQDIVLIGFGGHAKSVADSIERKGQYRIVGYTENEVKNSGYEYLGTDEILPKLYDSGILYAFVCVGYLGKGIIRNCIYDKVKTIGFVLPTIIDPSAIVSDSSRIGEGTFIGKDAVINAESKIGKMVIINTKALVEHECIIDDYSHIAVGAVLCGKTKVGKECMVGAGATVIQDVNISDNVIIGASSAVTKDIDIAGTYAGVPVHRIK